MMTTRFPALLAFAAVLAAHPAAAQEAAPRPGEVLTLDEAVRQGLLASPAVRQAEAARRAGAAGRYEGWGRMLPSLRLVSGINGSEVLQRTGEDQITGRIVQLPDSLVETQRRYRTDAALYADWMVLDPTALAGLRQARADAAAADHALDGARARVAAEVTLAYLDALEAAAVLELRRAERDRAAELRRIAEGQLEVGAVPELDVLQARLTEGDAELVLLEAETTAEAALGMLAQHLEPGVVSAAALVEPGIPDAGALPAEEALRRRVLEGSPEIAALRAERSAAVAARTAERMRFLPTVSLGAIWSRTELGQTREAFTWGPRNEASSYRLTVTWGMLEQPGRRVADGSRAGAAVQTADARLALRRATLERELETALGTLRRARLLHDRAAANVALAARQREQAAERYALGVAPIVERLQAEGLARDAERQALTARYATLRALAELQRATGTRVLPYPH